MHSANKNSLFEYTNIKTVGLPNINLKDYLSFYIIIIPECRWKVLSKRSILILVQGKDFKNVYEYYKDYI